MKRKNDAIKNKILKIFCYFNIQNFLSSMKKIASFFEKFLFYEMEKKHTVSYTKEVFLNKDKLFYHNVFINDVHCRVNINKVNVLIWFFIPGGYYKYILSYKGLNCSQIFSLSDIFLLDIYILINPRPPPSLIIYGQLL